MPREALMRRVDCVAFNPVKRRGGLRRTPEELLKVVFK